MAVPHAPKLFAATGLLIGLCTATQSTAAPALVVDASSGEVLHQEDATRPWYPASVTKLMTVYVALNAVRTGRLSLQTPMRVSNRAARAVPSKMGFKPGTEVTLENALKIIMVKSANDTSITIAEGVAGSVEAFAAEMNDVARGIGMRESNFVNPNGLHNPAHVSSARDMAVLARRLLIDFPQHSGLFGIGALQLGRRIIPTHNGLIGRYPGADGMKTGFVCASGFNVVATATRGGRKLIAVVMGAPNARLRTLQAMALFDASFSIRGSGSPEALASVGGVAPDMRPEICGPGRKHEEEVPIPIAATTAGAFVAHEDSGSAAAFFAADQRRGQGSGPSQGRAMASFAGVGLGQREILQPIPIYIGRAPGWNGKIAGPTGPDEDPLPEVAEKPAKKSRVAARAPASTKQIPVAAKPAPGAKSAQGKKTTAGRQVAQATAKPPVKPRGKVAAVPAQRRGQ